MPPRHVIFQYHERKLANMWKFYIFASFLYKFQKINCSMVLQGSPGVFIMFARDAGFVLSLAQSFVYNFL